MTLGNPKMWKRSRMFTSKIGKVDKRMTHILGESKLESPYSGNYGVPFNTSVVQACWRWMNPMHYAYAQTKCLSTHNNTPRVEIIII